MIFLQEAAVPSTPSFALVEYFLVAVLIGAQGWLLIQTLGKISVFRGLLAQPPLFDVWEVHVGTQALEDAAPNADLFQALARLEPQEGGRTVDLIGYADSPNAVSLGILNTLNRYLLKSRGQVADFALVKDVVERQSDALEEEINLATPIPLYLGLLGTMVGVVIGVYNMSEFTATDAGKLGEELGAGIAVLLSGVKIAMIASAAGLLATVILSLAFRGAKAAVERQKNAFYSLIQSELLPLLNESVASSIGNLQSNLMRFNEEFGQNLASLNEVMRSNEGAIRLQQESIETQRQLAQEIKEADLAKLAQANVTIWRELKVGVGQLEQFNAYLTSLNGFVTNSQALEGRMHALLDRTNQFGELYDRSVQSMVSNEALMRFLQTHFSELEARKDLINGSLLKVDDAVSQGFDELRDHLLAKTNEFKSTLLKEEDLMSQALASNRTNLDKLRHLEPIAKDFAELSKKNDSNARDMHKAVVELSQKFSKLLLLQEEISKQRQSNILKSAYGWLFEKTKD